MVGVPRRPFLPALPTARPPSYFDHLSLTLFVGSPLRHVGPMDYHLPGDSSHPCAVRCVAGALMTFKVVERLR